MTGSFPFIEVSGGPTERGRAYGRAAADQIAAGIEMYRESFANSGIEWREAVSLAHDFVPEIVSYDESYLQEMKAIAEGADQPLENIIIINARTELLFWKNRVETPDECTAIIALPSVTADGHMLHGQNWDWNPKCENSCVVLCIRHDDGPDVLTFVEAGQLARSGMNSAGIALTANGLHSAGDYGRVGIPNPFIRRRLLRQDRLAPALFSVTSASISFSHFLLISESSGEVVGLEATPDEIFWMQPEGGILSHANHFKTAAARARVKDVGFYRTPETVYRDSRAWAGLVKDKGNITPDTFKAILADEYGMPDSILRHPAARPGGNLSATVASIIMDTTDKRMWIAASPYKGIEYTEYGF